MNVETAFLKIYGREAKPEETNRFNRLAKELDIRENDAIWSMVFLLGHPSNGSRVTRSRSA